MGSAPHHLITGDARANVDFYTRVLGPPAVKKTVNQDDPTVYHLFYADDRAAPAPISTFFEYPGARPGRAGDGMVHLIVLRVRLRPRSLDFWRRRLGDEGSRRAARATRSSSPIPEGLAFRAFASSTADEPLVAAPRDPAGHALQGFLAAAPTPAEEPGAEPRPMLERSGSRRRDGGLESRAPIAAAPGTTTSRRPSPASRAPAPVPPLAWWRRWTITWRGWSSACRGRRAAEP